ncbi:MAG: sigma factor [Actinomycetota bacterium]
MDSPAVAPGEAEASPRAGSFENFFEVEHRRLYHALGLIAGRTQEAEELMQEAFVKVWERWDRVSVMDSPTGYLYRTALNLVRSRRRRAARLARRVLPVAGSRDPYEAIEIRDEVARGLSVLPPRQRQAIVLTECWTSTRPRPARSWAGISGAPD